MRLLVDPTTTHYSLLQRFWHWLRTPTAGIVEHCSLCHLPLKGDPETIRQMSAPCQSYDVCAGQYVEVTGERKCMRAHMVWR